MVKNIEGFGFLFEKQILKVTLDFQTSLTAAVWIHVVTFKL